MPLGQAPAFKAPTPETESEAKFNLWGFALANIGAIAYGLAAEYLIKDKTPASRRIITAGTAALSTIAIIFSFRVVIQPLDAPLNPFWRVIAGFSTYVNMIVGIRAGFDFFKETPELPAFHKFVREVAKV